MVFQKYSTIKSSKFTSSSTKGKNEVMEDRHHTKKKICKIH